MRQFFELVFIGALCLGALPIIVFISWRVTRNRFPAGNKVLVTALCVSLLSFLAVAALIFSESWWRGDPEIQWDIVAEMAVFAGAFVATGIFVVVWAFGGLGAWLYLKFKRVELAPPAFRTILPQCAVAAVLIAGFGYLTAEMLLSQKVSSITSPDELRQWSEKWWIKNNDAALVYIAMNHSCPPDVLTKLAASDDDSVRLEVATNPATPCEVYSKIKVDSYYLMDRSIPKRKDCETAP